MSVNKIFGWQASQWESLLAAPENLHHALLLMGPAGLGKSVFGEALAARLLCESPASTLAEACGRCDACRWFASGNHPDYRLVAPLDDAAEEEEGAGAKTTGKKTRSRAQAAPIKVDQIRELEDFVFMGSHRHGRRVAVIDPAEAMNAAAANSILKILEEPPTNVYFVLICSNPRRLLPTLRSRCRQVRFMLPERSVAAAWLATQGISDPEAELSMAGGAPLTVANQAKLGGRAAVEPILAPLMEPGIEPLTLAAKWDSLLRSNAGLTMEQIVDALQRWLYDLVRMRAAVPHYFTGRSEAMAKLASRADPRRLSRCYQDLLKIRAVARHPLNPLLFLEDIAARCVAATSARP